MSDAELIHFANYEAGDLTGTAFQILKTEFERRHLDPEILERIENGSYKEEQARLKKISRMVPDISNTSALMMALNEKRDGENDEAIVYHLMETGMEEEQAWMITALIKVEASDRLSKSKSTMLTSLFITCAGLGLNLISPEKSYITFLDIVASCSIVFGILRFLKGYFDYNKFKTILHIVETEKKPDASII